eukprot:CAMPEP_0198733912 /NCGR_PEP_ID=MMETSP1475-20131203/49123_1 /TAXON_ID= ORGANISM="Unidentified sp., Strain CCMP1999" /NCGR_SAMPLE_ID=MMETSP1475 /ASSEMBLY_ACC=CAM_ASM_001111 /LENGTH=574 /DNA_ID=CAMNT_0044497285 /DNA_START=68 /DNA_END=1789 /DNA_ORIENTATION=+
MASANSNTSTDSGFSHSLVSVQIVHIDYYLCSLADISGDRRFLAVLRKAERFGSTKVPVVRIFGATPAGQRTCVHLHGALPHFFVPLPDSVPNSDVKKFCTQLHSSLERAIAASLRGRVQAEQEEGSRPGERYVCDVQPVLRRSIYGYENEARVFLKISAFNPALIGRLAAVCASGLLPNIGGELQPFESHIPFTLQVLVDLNLVGMGHLNLASCKFRLPLPDCGPDVNSQFLRDPHNRKFARGLEEVHTEFFWGFSVPRRSRSDIELDAFVHDVLNKESLQEIDPDAGSDPQERAVHTLRVLWEEERLRRKGEPDMAAANYVRSVHSGPELSRQSHYDKIIQLVDRDRVSPPKTQHDRDSLDLEGQTSTKTQDLHAEEAELAGEILALTYAGQEVDHMSAEMSEQDQALISWLEHNADEDSGRSLDDESLVKQMGAAMDVNTEVQMEETTDQWEDILECTQVDNPELQPGSASDGDIPQLDGADGRRKGKDDSFVDLNGKSKSVRKRESGGDRKKKRRDGKKRSPTLNPLVFESDGQEKAETVAEQRKAERQNDARSSVSDAKKQSSARKRKR